MLKYFTLEASDAWGAVTFIDANGKWTKRRNEAKRFAALAEAQAAQQVGLGKLCRIEAYTS